MKISIVVEIAIPVYVENIDDSIVVVIDVFPVENTVSIPVVELGERGATGLTSWVWVDWVRVGCCWAVPPDDVSCLVEWETVVLVVDVVVVKIVLKVGCITADENVSEVIWACCPTEFWIEPIVNSVVVLIERSKAVVIKVLIVIDFTIEASLAVCISTRRLVRSIVFERVVA